MKDKRPETFNIGKPWPIDQVTGKDKVFEG